MKREGLSVSADNLRGAFDGSPEDVVLSLRAKLRSVTDLFEMLLDDGQFPTWPRTIDGKSAEAQWWEDRYELIKQARAALALEVAALHAKQENSPPSDGAEGGKQDEKK